MSYFRTASKTPSEPLSFPSRSSRSSRTASSLRSVLSRTLLNFVENSRRSGGFFRGNSPVQGKITGLCISLQISRRLLWKHAQFAVHSVDCGSFTLNERVCT